MDSPNSTDNPGSLTPVRVMLQCTDDGSADGSFVDAICNSSGQLIGESVTLSERVASFTAEPFPANGLIVLEPGKCVYRGSDGSLVGHTGTFVMDSLSVLDTTNFGLDLDIYLGVGDYYPTWSSTPAEDTFHYLTTLTGGTHVGVIRVRESDYTTQYSAAGTPVSKIATKLVAMPFPIPASSSSLLKMVVVYAGPLTDDLPQYGLSVMAVLRLGS